MSQPNTAFDPANSNLQNPNLTGSNLPVPVDPMLARLAQKANSATMRQEIEQAQNQQRRYVPQINLQPQPNYQNFPTFNYPNPNLPSQNQPRQNPNFVAPTKKKSRFQDWWKWLAAILLFLSILGVGGFFAYDYYARQNSLVNAPFVGVTTSITGPASLSQGAAGKWSITIDNAETTAMQDVELDLTFDPDFQFLKSTNATAQNLTGNIYKIPKLDAIGGGQSQSKIIIDGQLNGQVDSEAVISAKLIYTPTVIATTTNPKRIASSNVIKTKITSPDIKISITPTEGSVQNNGEAQFVVKVKNSRDTDYQDLRIRMIYPAGNVFGYISSQLNVAGSNVVEKSNPDDGDDIWYISRLAGLSEQTLTVRGKITVKNQQKIPFGVELALKDTDTNNYNELSKAYKDLNIVSEPLLISTRIEKSDSLFSPDEQLKFIIEYENRSQTILKNVEILGFVEDRSSLLDLNTVSFVGGSRPFVNNNQVQWTSTNTPQLATVGPNVTGKLEYNIKVKKDILDKDKNQSRYTIRPFTKVKATNLQEITNSGTLYKMKSNLRFSQLPTTEVPIPQNTQANRKRYRITWAITSEQNDVDDLVVSAISRLPPTAWQSGSIVPSDQLRNVSYNKNSGEISWKVGKVPAYTGIGSPELKVSFDLEIELQNISDLTLHEAPVVTATDNFTAEPFSLAGVEAKNRVE